MKSYSSSEIVSRLLADGYFLVNTLGNHHQYKHPQKGLITVLLPVKGLTMKTVKNIGIQAGIIL